MRIAELLLQDFDAEMANARKTLERIPEEKPDYKPHEKSMAMGRLAMHVATLPRFGTTILTEPGMDMGKPTHAWPDMTFKSRADLLATFDENAAKARATLAKATDEEMSAPWEFRFGDHIISNKPRSATYRLMFFNHLIHHRAQLGVYLRLNEEKVPGIYGPSADEPF
jgi:uncharacterized damage-inducible protein DinB